MQEPRVHFAIVCASVGCPRLKNEAYTADKLEQQLRENTLDLFSRSQNLQVDSGSRTSALSCLAADHFHSCGWLYEKWGMTNEHFPVFGCVT